MFFKKRRFLKKSRLSNIFFLNDIIVKKNNNFLSFKKFDLEFNLFLPEKIFFFLKNNFLYIFCNNCYKKENFLLGTYCSLINNLILSFKDKYFKKLLLVGVGYKAILVYNFLYLYIGYSHPVLYKIPQDIELSVSSFVEITISGFDKNRVSQISSIIKKIKIPDVYKGKGIKYLNEVLKFKEIKKK